jgi:hypothetical protein
VNPQPKVVYTPPRPNLGPEPLPPPNPWLALGLVLAALVLAILALRVWRRRRRRKAAPASVVAMAGPPDETAGSPHERMIAWSVAIREALAARFGPAWRARTTEEIAADARLIDVLGPERAEGLIHFLAAVDRAKFAAEVDGPSLEEVVSDSYLRELTELMAAPPSPPVADGRRPLTNRSRRRPMI